MNADDFLHRHGEESERVVLMQIGLGRKGQPDQIPKRPDAVGGNAGLGQLLPIMRDRIRDAINARPQSLHLKFFPFRWREGFDFIPDVAADISRFHSLPFFTLWLRIITLNNVASAATDWKEGVAPKTRQRKPSRTGGTGPARTFLLSNP